MPKKSNKSKKSKKSKKPRNFIAYDQDGNPITFKHYKPGSDREKKAIKNAIRKGHLKFNPYKWRQLSKQRKDYAPMDGSALIYLTAVIEYMVAELIELAGQDVGTSNGQLKPTNIRRAIAFDDDLSRLMRHVIIPESSKVNTLTEEEIAKMEEEIARVTALRNQ